MPIIARWLGLIFLIGGSAAWAAEDGKGDRYNLPERPATNVPSVPGSAQIVPAPFSPPPVGPSPAAAAPLAPAERTPPLELGSGDRGRNERSRPTGGLPAMATVAGSLAVVLGLFFLAAWAMRRASPRGTILLPPEVFEVLGRAPLAARQQVHLLRCGRKLLLVSVTQAGTETLAEVTEPEEVDRLAGLCRQAHTQSATAAFRQVFGQWAPRHSGRRLPDDRDLEEVGAGQRNGRRREDDDA